MVLYKNEALLKHALPSFFPHPVIYKGLLMIKVIYGDAQSNDFRFKMRFQVLYLIFFLNIEFQRGVKTR